MSARTLYTCDCCKSDVGSGIEVEVQVPDGEHPHNGSRMYRSAQVHICGGCLARFAAEKPDPLGACIKVVKSQVINQKVVS